MEYTNLGSTGLKVSRLGFGGIPIQRITQEEATALIHKLPEYGVNYIDTARGYTVSEEYLGIAMEGIAISSFSPPRAWPAQGKPWKRISKPALKTSAPTISTCIRYITHPLPR